MITPAMKTSPSGRKLIELWEGSALRAYQDSVGVWTIGYGHTTAAGLPRVFPGMTITAEQADAILASDLAAVEVDVNHHLTAQVNQNQFDSLVSFDFNVGALDRSNVLRAVNANLGDATVKADLLMWSYAGGHFLQGLYRRRQAEFLLYSTGKVQGP